MDYFLLALFGLATVGSVSTKNYAKGLISVMIGLVISMIGLDPLMGTKRLTFGIQNLTGGVSTVPHSSASLDSRKFSLLYTT